MGKMKTFIVGAAVTSVAAVGVVVGIQDGSKPSGRRIITDCPATDEGKWNCPIDSGAVTIQRTSEGIIITQGSRSQTFERKIRRQQPSNFDFTTSDGKTCKFTVEISKLVKTSEGYNTTKDTITASCPKERE